VRARSTGGATDRAGCEAGGDGGAAAGEADGEAGDDAEASVGEADGEAGGDGGAPVGEAGASGLASTRAEASSSGDVRTDGEAGSCIWSVCGVDTLEVGVDPLDGDAPQPGPAAGRVAHDGWVHGVVACTSLRPCTAIVDTCRSSVSAEHNSGNKNDKL
jgi:hypothetical protein